MKNLLPFLILCCTLFSCDKDSDISVDAGIRSDNFAECLRPFAQNILDNQPSSTRAQITLFSCTGCERGMVYSTPNGGEGADIGGTVRTIECEVVCIVGGIAGNIIEDCVDMPEFIEVVWEDPR